VGVYKNLLVQAKYGFLSGKKILEENNTPKDPPTQRRMTQPWHTSVFSVENRPKSVYTQFFFPIKNIEGSAKGVGGETYDRRSQAVDSTT
jgi:hypothetical protein